MWCENAQPARFCFSQNSVHGAWRHPQRGGGGTTQAPTSPCRGAARHTQLTSPCAFQGRPDARVRSLQTLLGLSLCPAGQEGLGQSDSQGASGHQVLCKATWEVCAPSVQGAGAGRVPGPFLPSRHLRACVFGAQTACGAASVALEGMSGQQALVLCPRLRIRETTEEPTPMQTHEGLFTSSGLGPSAPDTAEQRLGPRD